MGLAEINGVTIYYEIHGKGEPLILISGFGVDHTVWETMISALAEQYEVIIFDNRGIGQSSVPIFPYTISNMSDDVAKLLEILGYDQVNVVGHSMGGAIAQHLALSHPQKVKKLVLCNTFAKLEAAPSLAFASALVLLEELVPKAKVFAMLIPWIFSSNFLENPDQMYGYLSRMQKNPYPQPTIGFRRQGEALKAFDSRTIVHKITHPTFIIASENDIISPISNSEELKKKIPNASLKVVANAGHALQVEKPDEFSQLILGFLK